MKNYNEKYEQALERCKREFNFNNLAYSHEEIKQRLERVFPELNDDERIRKYLIDGMKHLSEKSSFFTAEVSKGKVISWLEKQGGQKHSDKIEPKFKVGDWLVCCNYEPEQIIGIKNNMYEMSNGDIRPIDMINNNQNIRLWSIKDAKDGDVLYTSSTASNEVFIFKGLSKEGHIECYCSYDSEDKYCDGKYHFIGKPTFMTHPATKEKRELLFQKIVKKGYIWDPEKKELKKIEQKPAWSEDDEQMINDIIEAIDEQYAVSDYQEMVSWLKSLKERYTWKPSEEQMKALVYVINLMASSENPTENNYYYNLLKDMRTHLKKLREE